MMLKLLGFRALYLLLMLCCMTGTDITYGNDIPAANQVLYRPARPHCKIPDIDTAENLRVAARNIRSGNLDKVKEVIEQGLPVNAVFEDQFGILGQMYTAQVGLLDMAVMFKKQDILDLLLKYGANPEGCGTHELAPSFLAIINNDFKSLNKLTEAGARPDQWIGPEQLQQTALHYLVSHPDACASEPVSREVAGSMQALLTHGADVNALNAMGETPLIQSVQNCQYNSAYTLTTLLLITHAADPFVHSGKGHNIFHKMVSNGNLSRNRDLWRLLANYVKAGGDEMMKLARDYPYFRTRLDAIQADISSPEGVLDWFWKRAYSYGTLQDHVSSMVDIFNDQRFIRHDLNKVNSLVNCRKGFKCFTPLHYAGQTLLTPQAMEWLKWLGSDFSELSDEGDTVLHYAIKHQQVDSLDILAPYFIDPMQRNSEGMTSFDVAMAFTHDEDRLAAIGGLCRMPLNSDESEICSAYFDQFNARCAQLIAPENITLSADPERQQRYLSSFAVKSCLGSSDQPLSSRQKLEILTEPLDTTYQRINAHDTTWHFSASLHLQQLQSFAQLKHYLMYDRSPEKGHIQTWLVQRDDPALFMYTLTMGVKPAIVDSPCDLPEPLAYLCQSPIAAINDTNFRTYNALLSLYGYYDFSVLPVQNQYKDSLLYLAIHSKENFWVEQLLSTGANPNAFISQEQLSYLPKNIREELTSMSSCGLLADALRLEKDQAEATMSRLLLLFGASVDPVIPHGCSSTAGDLQIPPLSWAGRIKDQEVTKLLNYFDPVEVSRRAWNNKPANDWYTNQQTVTNALSLTSEQYSLILGNEVQTPLCTCLGLQKIAKENRPLAASENPSFVPYCQQLTDELPEDVKQSICSPAVFH